MPRARSAWRTHASNRLGTVVERDCAREDGQEECDRGDEDALDPDRFAAPQSRARSESCVVAGFVLLGEIGICRRHVRPRMLDRSGALIATRGAGDSRAERVRGGPCGAAPFVTHFLCYVYFLSLIADYSWTVTP